MLKTSWGYIMAKAVTAADFAPSLSAALQYYDTSMQEQIQKAVDKEAKPLKEDIIATSPDKTGKYKRGWKLVKKYEGAFKYTVIVHNKPRYNVVHLVEHGRGEKSIGARPHVLAAQEKHADALIKRIDDVIGSW